MFKEAWRPQRDQFWTPDMSGIDSASTVISAARRSGCHLVGVLRSHGMESSARRTVAEMGGDHAPQPNWYRIRRGPEYDARSKSWTVGRIPRGDSWEPHSSSPLMAPGVNVRRGDHLLAIGGEEIGPDVSPYERLVHLADQEVELTVSSNGASGSRKNGSAKSRRVVVKTLREETALRYRDWVESNRSRVHEETKGRVGYVHVPDMGPNGYSEFHRYFKLEAQHEGLVVDVRFNGGGHVSQILLEKLLRRRIGYDVNRWGEPDSYPQDAPMGPIVALTNEYAGSDGDMFSHAFKLNKLGPLIGKRTWGGVVGIWPRHSLVDGAITTQPEFAFWFEDVGWGIENYGTDPDIEVEIRPQDYAHGSDPQLDRAIAETMKLLRKAPPKLPKFKDRPKLRPGRLPKAH
ncbi:MAG: S41 family peptidase [Candidatus Eisenbacteria bacterium]